MPWGFFRSKDEDGNSRSDHQTSWLPMTKDDDGGRRTGWFSARNGNGTGHGDSWTDAAQNYLDVPGNWIAPVAAAALTLGVYSFYQSYLRRFPTPHHIAPGVFRKRSLFGKVTSVGDGDGFHLYHTPGGRLAGWGWLRRVPTDRKQLKGQTISIRLAGVDAPEAAHFGRPAQPFSAEALSFLENYVLHRRVRAYVYKRDQYERVVATVYLRRPPFFPRRDVGLELLRHGLAVAYEGKTGAEFGGDKMEAVYREAEETAKKKRVGMWGSAAGRGVGKRLLAKAVGASPAAGKSETPMEYKRRMKALEGGEGNGK